LDTNLVFVKPRSRVKQPPGYSGLGKCYRLLWTCRLCARDNFETGLEIELDPPLLAIVTFLSSHSNYRDVDSTSQVESLLCAIVIQVK